MILIDTHVLVWAMDDSSRLGQMAQSRIKTTERIGAVYVSAITPWEIALLVQKGRLVLNRDIGAWMAAALGGHAKIAPIEPAIALESVVLPEPFHSDPADRFIVATARHLAMPLVTADQAIIDYAALGHVEVVDARR